jgi:four helix bundle protein
MREWIDKLEERTKQFAIRVMQLSAAVEKTSGFRDAASQLARAAGSVAANHRATRRARSAREFIAKLHIVCEESDETVLWLEVIEAGCPAHADSTGPLLVEARELRAIFNKSLATARRRY